MFKKLRRSVLAAGMAAVMAASTVGAYAVQGGAGATVFQSLLDYNEGFTYTNTISRNSTYGREESYSMTTRPGGSVKPIVLACDTLYGALNINKIISYASGLGYKVVGAMNTDFFDTSTGIPLGVAIENGALRTSPEGYNAVCFDNQGNATVVQNAVIDIKLTNLGGGEANIPANQPKPVTEETTDASEGGEDLEATGSSGSSGNSETTLVEVPESQWVTNAGKTTSLHHLNKLRNQYGGLDLLDEHFSTVSTRTSSNGWFVRFKILEGSLTANGTMKLEVVQTYETDQPQAIGSGYMYLTADSRCGLEYEYEKYAVGDIVELTTSTNSTALANAAWATGCGDILVSEGQMTDTNSWTKSLDGKNPRSAIGIKADGTVVYYTVDGRQSDHSAGISLYQTAYELQSQGCVYVVNMDGGGSTALAALGIADSTATVKNSPSDGGLRKCATYVLLVEADGSDGKAYSLHLSNQNLVVFTNSHADLTYTAKDKGLSIVNTPADVTAQVTTGSGSVAGSVYTAGASTGMETLSLTSASTGASGTDTIYVVDTLSSLKVTVNGSEVTSMQPERGQQLQLAVAADYYGKSVCMDIANVRFSISEGLGTVNDTGLVTISSNPPSTGWVKVEAGGVSKTISFRFSGVFGDIDYHWAKDYITDLFERGIVKGNDDGNYYPDSNIKRCDFILMLYRAAGASASAVDQGFSDVSAEDYYYDAVNWAKGQGIARGSDGAFLPQNSMTREEAFAFTCRYLAAYGSSIMKEKIELADVSSLAAFEDSGLVAEYAGNYTAALIDLGIVNGSDGKINPRGLLTRGEMAKILSVTVSKVS